MNERNDMLVLDAIERYINDEMSAEEKTHFENMRKSNQEIDQLVVEHALFLQQINQFSEASEFRDTLAAVHHELMDDGSISEVELLRKSKVITLWNRYKRVAGIAASIAGIVAITLSSVVNSITPKTSDPKLQQLVHQVNAVKDNLKVLDRKIDNVSTTSQQQQQQTIIPRFNGTGFLVDSKGLMITNAHVVKNSKNIFVQNTRGEQFKAIVVRLDILKDVAFIKIDDENFKPSTLPYGIKHTGSDIAEPIFTLGYPRDEIVYGEGYLSARTGFNGDTLSCQISVDANPGNSGGPVFNRNGEVIGILSTKEISAEGAVFAVQSKYIYKALDELKKNSIYEGVKISSKSSLSGMDKTQQVKKIQDFVFMVKGD